MKNISRRVFIKGMAVAAVATAASTVLTGCKLPVTPDEVPGEEVPSAVQSQSYEAATDKVLTVSSTSLKVVEEANMAILSLKVVNGTDSAFDIKDGANVPSSGYYTNGSNISIYFDDMKGNYLTAPITEGLEGDIIKTTVSSGTTETGKLYINTPKTWNKMTVVVKVVKYVNGSTGDYVVKTMEFNYNK